MLTLSLCPTHTYTRTHTVAWLCHIGAYVVPSTCILQCEVSAIKIKRFNYDPSFKPRAICDSKVVTLVTTTLTAPCNLLRSYTAVSLGSRVGIPREAGCVDRGTRA